MSQTSDFDEYKEKLKLNLGYIEDDSFSWNQVNALLIIKLTNTDSRNKDRQESHATQIQLTSEREHESGVRKTEDFFPTLTLNKSFKSWRLSIPVRLNYKNIKILKGENYSETDGWYADKVQIRRRILNDNSQGEGNPTLHICYGVDLLALRETLKVGDYLVFVKLRNLPQYCAFGINSNVDLGNGKQMYIADNVGNDSSTFDYNTLTGQPLRQIGVSLTSKNKIYVGAPGTGKSYAVEKVAKLIDLRASLFIRG